jgi:NTE family protein/lysophospholipid hydrolase
MKDGGESKGKQVPGGGLAARIASTDLFRALDAATLEALEVELELVHLPGGEVLLKQGEPAGALYVLTHGRLGVKIRHPDGTEIGVDELDPGVTVGDMELLTGSRCFATVFALEDTELVRLSKAGFSRLSETHPQVVNEFTQTLLPRFQRAQLSGTLSSLFGQLDAATVHALQSEMEWVHLPAGEILMRQGDPGDAMYIIVQGRVRFLVQSPDGIERSVGEAGAGECVGEFALLTDDTRTATVCAVRDTDVVRLSRPVFDRLVQRYPQMMREIARIMIRRRQRSLRAEESPRATNFAIVPTGPDVPLSKFGRRLAATLGAFGETLHMSAERFDRAYGGTVSQTSQSHAANLVLTAWLNEREREYRYIVYETDASWSPWTRRCLRQADMILLVGQAGSDPARGEIEVAMQRPAGDRRTELVLLHPTDAQYPEGTALWLEKRHVRAHHHVRANNDRDMDRLVRRITGRALGLVLSGGGARGFGHVGAIRALEETGLYADIVGGTSMGALVGGLYALGFDYERLFALAETFSSRKALFDYTLPLVSIFRTEKVTNLLVQMSKDVQVEDLWLPYYCVSCNVTQGNELVHWEGPLWESIRASLAIPGVFSPVLKSGDLLVDGGTINNFPLDVMRGFCEGGTIIGIDVTRDRSQTEQYDFGPSVSGWQVLWSRINPFAPRIQVPSILNNLARTMDVNSAYRIAATRHLADLIIRLPVESFGTLDFPSYEEIIRIGYEATRTCLEKWRPAEF